ncbi:MAG: 3-deoxy-manno-octulosonate cytidylyltransferase synthetase [Chthoniobacter sp.]|jgi:3-deoxy-manno-octulosonate cytidylyltransferase (CMP-KDO synthetase)|nr:3-deoxy-manno-octulosonate cytidylyltransferase synthetase [Chthoniobacter sp.]
MPKVAIVIPARYGSTRLPGKPLLSIAGKPLIQHVWERCSRARGIAVVIVATDDLRIAETAFGFNAEVALTSPRHRSGTDRVAEVAAKLRGFTHVINVQGDEPLVDPALVSKLAKTMAADPRIEMITAASAFPPEEDRANPNLVKVVVDRAGDALYFSRSVIPNTARAGTPRAQTASLRHLGIYGYTTKFLLQFVRWKPSVLEEAESLEQLRALENGAKIRVVRTKSVAPGVDTPEDVLAVERLLAA